MEYSGWGTNRKPWEEKMQIPLMPFKVLAFAPFRPQEKNFWDHEPVQVDKTNVDQVMEDMGLSLYVPLPKNLCPAGGLTLGFQRLKDFHPDTIIANTPFLQNLREAIKFVEDSRFKGLSDEETYARLKSWPDLPIEIKFEPRRTKASPSSPIDDILKKVSLPDEGTGHSTETQSFISQIESLLQQILKHIFSHEDLRNLESVWRGLRFLLKQEGGNGEIKLSVVPVSLETLEETLDHLLPGLIQDLPSLVILDLPFDNSPRSLDLLEKIALFSETLLVPAVCWITPKFFYLDTWQDLPKLPFLPHYLEEPVFAKWRHLKETSSAQWMALTCNRFLIRFPYGTDNKPGLVQFEESEKLWISPVWGAGNLIAQSFVKTGWPTHFTEWQSIRLDNLALSPAEGNKYLATEALFAEDRIKQFIKGGMIPLVAPSNKDIAFLPVETTVAGSPLSHQLFLSRITQFLFWCKDNWEQGLEPKVLEKRLKEAFFLFWEKTGHQRPQVLELSVSKPNPEKPAMVRIAVEPSRQILPSGKKVELEMNW